MLIHRYLEITDTEIALLPPVSYTFRVSFMFSGAVPSCPDKVPRFLMKLSQSQRPDRFRALGSASNHKFRRAFQSLLQLIAFWIAFKSAPGSVPSLALPL